MFFSVIIPFYKDFLRLERLIRSLSIAVNFGGFDGKVEVIVINDFPPQENEFRNFFTLSFLKSIDNLKIILLSNDENLGVAESRNKGLSSAIGEFIHVIDQDDEVDKRFYQLVKKNLTFSNFVLTNGTFFNELNKASYPLYILKPKLSIRHLIEDDFIRSPGQVVFSRKFLEKVKFPNPVFNRGCDDRFFWIKTFLEFPDLKASYLHQKLYKANLHGNNNSHDSKNLYLSCVELWEILLLELPDHLHPLAKRNIRAIKFAVGLNKDFLSFLANINYRFTLNRLLRFLVKRFTYYVKGSNH